MRTIIINEVELLHEFYKLKKSKTLYLVIKFPHESVNELLVKGKFQIKKL